MLQARKRIALPISVSLWRSDWLTAGLQELPLNGDIALAAVELIEFHADPADRFITATAQAIISFTPSKNSINYWRLKWKNLLTFVGNSVWLASAKL